VLEFKKMKNMRVLHISPFYYPSIGGLERFCEEISKRSVKLGIEVHILTQNVIGYKSLEQRNGVTIHRINPIFHYSKAQMTPNIQKYVTEIDPDIIHVQGPAPGMVDFVKKHTSKMLMTCHNDLSLNNTGLYKIMSAGYRIFAFPRVISKLDRLILLSEAFRFHSKLFEKVPSEKLAVIPNGVDIETFSPGNHDKDRCKKELSIKSKFLGLFVASMEPFHMYKGLEYLLQSIKLIKDLDITFYLIGEGELKKKYIELAESLGIMDKVKFTGKVDDDLLLTHYRAADIFILPSTGVEFMPLVLIEAMACGTPVIVTRIHGPMEMVKEGYNGLIVEPRSSEDLSLSIRKMISDESKLVQMQHNARDEALRKYSWNNVMKMYAQEYEKLLA
jgi:glycosyltransferase involved in cell wall biosynthesis